MRRWNPWTAVMAVVLTTGVYALERLLGVDPLAALVDAAAGFHDRLSSAEPPAGAEATASGRAAIDRDALARRDPES